MAKEVTITLTGDTALDYLNNDLLIKYNKLQGNYYKLQEEYKELEKDYDSYIDSIEGTTFNTNTNIKNFTEEVIKPNPIHFPATQVKHVQGTNWKDYELSIIEDILDEHKTNTLFSGVTITKLKESNSRSEAAIRSKLNEYGIGIKNGKTYLRG